MTIVADQISDLVSVERGEIDRRIFSDPDIFELEMENIFGRAWLFLCHETQLRRPGDFFEAPMGRDNVLIVRQKDNGLKAMLNTCMHRGNAVCRAEEGNTKNFMCTYHGWTYDLAGRLVGVPGLEALYGNGSDLDPAQHGLRQVAQLDTYKGFVFATMDAFAPGLQEYLGATGRLGLDLLAERGDMEVVPGIQKFVIDCNWKFTVDNLFDWYHPMITHMSALQLGFLEPPPEPGVAGRPVDHIDASGAATADGRGLDLSSGGARTSVTVLGEYGHAISGPTAETGPDRTSAIWRKRPEAIAALGPVGIHVGGHPNIFPTAFVSVSGQLSLRVPRSPQQTEIWWFTFVDKNLGAEERQMQVWQANHVFGPAGLLEQEDGENWSQSTKQTLGVASRRVPQLLTMDLGRGKIIKEHGLARIDGATSEHGQVWTYKAWAAYVSGATWDQIRAATVPGDVF